MISDEARNHLERYWKNSVQYFQVSEFALAAFFAITLIEEVGKIIIFVNKDFTKKLDKKSFYNHRSKYRYAVFSTLFVNTRITRVYGKHEKRFAGWFRKDELLNLRNSALYMEQSSNRLITPREIVKKEDSFLLVCISGEVLAEIQGVFLGTGPNEWERLIHEIDVFRENNVQVNS